MVGAVAAVGEPASGVIWRDGGEGGPGGGAEVVVGAGLSPAERVLDLGAGVLDRIEVGRVGGQRQEAGTARLDGGTDGRASHRAVREARGPVPDRPPPAPGPSHARGWRGAIAGWT